MGNIWNVRQISEIWKILEVLKLRIKIWKFRGKNGNLEKRRNLGKNLEILRIFGNLEKIKIWRKKIWKFKKRFGNLGKNWKLEKKLENILKQFGNFENIWKFRKEIGNLENFLKLVRIWKVGKNLEFWKKLGNLKKKWKLEKNLKLGNKFESLIQTQLELWFFKWFSTLGLGEGFDPRIFLRGTTIKSWKIWGQI